MRNSVRCILAALAAAFSQVAPPAGAATTLEIGYMPILPVSQLFVALENGWLAQEGIEAKLVQFQNGPAMVQALLAGQLDVAHFGIGPAMVARAKGADIKVVASSIIEQISFVALAPLAPYFKQDPATAFARFKAEKGRKAIVSTFPVGSVPQTVLQYWLVRQLRADPNDIQVVYQGAAQVQQALNTGAVDGAAILEPIVAQTLGTVAGAEVVAKGSAMFKDQPGAVMAVREKLVRDQTKLVEALVRVHERATRMLNEQPDKAAPAIAKYVGGGRMEDRIVEAATKASVGTFVADPNRILAGSKEMRDFQAQQGTLEADVDLNALIDTTIYDRMKR